MFNSLSIPFKNFIAPLAMSAAILSLSITDVLANPIIIHRSPRAYPQTGNFIYGSPIPTAIPLNPVTGKPARFDTNTGFPYHQQGIRGRTHRRGSHHSNRDNTIIINPTIIIPHRRHYYPSHSRRSVYYGSPTNIVPHRQHYYPSTPSHRRRSVYYGSPTGVQIQFGN
ncbi:hypothetical protein IQ249_11665 [Lusitaniella coriacea LEGE 07157]|uniref:Uncharacterized protein n=1 Tax=Lusitaniella coriacea LEGE 07157 TaxID=945747 RepID=A0A8J7DWL3_9CYAN|nr:hypothetical protein [Lusitaniella coriacea]MBE9116557.1 hypothetical protein [Lusitaniella coriacea LEGE 07157]